LEKLYKNRHVGRRHTSEDNVIKGFPKHVRGDIKKAWKLLIKSVKLNDPEKFYPLSRVILPGYLLLPNLKGDVICR